MKKILITFLLLLLPFDMLAHQHNKNNVIVKDLGSEISIISNGLPNHETGSFPNSKNPNSILKQAHNFKVTKSPEKLGNKTAVTGRYFFGVALNGIPFDPGTAECYGTRRGSRPPRNCEWKEEAIYQGKGQLGLDYNNAHVQPDGTYHYHGVPTAHIENMDKDSDLKLVGYAADGFKILFSDSGKYKPSYKLKSGTRPNGPSGNYDGKYTQDYELIANYGNLDQCNGTEIDGKYVYFLTKDFPYIPRCWVGKPDDSFSKQMNNGNRGQGRRPSRRMPPRRF